MTRIGYELPVPTFLNQVLAHAGTDDATRTTDGDVSASIDALDRAFRALR